MGKIINFGSKNKTDKQSVKLMKMADEIDSIIIKHVHDTEIELHEIAGILAHRLGALMKNTSIEQRHMLLEVCKKILDQQANIDKVD